MCKIIDNNNIFLHVPKCAGTTVVHNLDLELEDKDLNQLDQEINYGHFGIYPLIIKDHDVSKMKKHLILRDPVEWYPSLFNMANGVADHPYNVFTTDFNYFFKNMSNLKNMDTGDRFYNHLKNHLALQRISGRIDYDLDYLIEESNNSRYIDKHPDFNILLSKRNINEGLYTYFVLSLITKINPLELFSKTKEDIIKNLDDYIVDNLYIYNMDEVENLLNNVGYEYDGVSRNILRYDKKHDFYNDQMKREILGNHEIIEEIKRRCKRNAKQKS